MKHIVIIGAGHAGGRFALRVANLRPDYALTLIGREPVPPYERPPLSKGYLLGKMGLDAFAIWPGGDVPPSIDLRLGFDVVAIDRQARTVRLGDDSTISYDILVIATGRRNRRLGLPGEGLTGVHTLRTISDADTLAASLSAGQRLVIIGGGLIGLEVAAAAREKALDVTVLEASGRVLERVAPPALANALSARHQAEGVRLRTAVRTIGLEADGTGAVSAVKTDAAGRIACDRVLVAAGAVPDMELAAEAGLAIDKAIAVDGRLQTSDPAIYAIGDVAAYWSRRFACRIAGESWHHADQQSETLARMLAGEDEEYDQTPWAWSDQYDMTLSVVGNGNPLAPTAVRKGKAGGEMHFQFRDDGRLLGAWSLAPHGAMARDMRVASRLIEMDAVIAPAALLDPSTDLRKLLPRN